MISDLKSRPLTWVFENVYKPAHAARLQSHGVAAAADAVEAFVTLIGSDPAIATINTDSLKAFEALTRSQGYSYHVARMRRERIEAIVGDFGSPRRDPTAHYPVQGTLRHYVQSEFSKITPDYAVEYAMRAVRRFCRWLNRDILVADVTPEMIVAFEAGVDASPRTAVDSATFVRRVMRTVDPIRFRIKSRGRPIVENPATISPWLLLNLFDQRYEPTRLRPKSSNMKRLYRCTLRMFGRFLGRHATLEDFTDETVSGFAAWRLQQGKTKNTVNRDLWNLLAFWRWCHDKGLVDLRPDVPIEAAPKRVPIAWTVAELRKLMRTIDRLEGQVGLFPAAAWWHALILMLWDTGERIGAVIDLDWACVDLRSRWVTFPAETRKGGRDDSAVRLSRETVDALRAIRASNGPVFPWPLARTSLWRKYGQILDRAGLPSDRMSKFHRIRKSVASYVEARGGNATAMLRHSDRRVTEKYIDPRIAKRQQPVDVLFRLTDSA